MRRWACAGWLALAAAVACLNPQLVPCGDLVCPPSTVCIAGDRCASPDELAACAGKADGTACATPAGDGQCAGGACLTTVCGNHVVDPGEACDDGNTTGGDGCSANCKKIEMCGDGVLDAGERCDDGNTNPADGCDMCVPTRWAATSLLGQSVRATSTPLGQTTDITVDRHGNLYIAEETPPIVLRVDPAGDITRFAGTGEVGFSGDAGPATSAQFALITSLATDGFGNVYIGDEGNQRIRRVATDGNIGTIAGNGNFGATGDGGNATNATLESPSGLVQDGLGGLYVADQSAHEVRFVDGGGTITRVVGTGASGSAGDGGSAARAQLASPQAMALDRSGALYIADAIANDVRRVAPSAATGNSTITTFRANLSAPQGIAVDGAGNVYVSDGDVVLRISPAGVATTYAGGGSSEADGVAATTADLQGAGRLALDPDGNLWIQELGRDRIRRVDALTGTIATVAGTGAARSSGDGGAGTNAPLGQPAWVLDDGSGGVYVSDQTASYVLHVDGAGVVHAVAGTGRDGDSGDGSAATSAQIDVPGMLARDAAGDVFFADTTSGRICKVTPDGILYDVVVNLANPVGLAFDGSGTLYVSERSGHRVRKLVGGALVTVAGTGAAGDTGDGSAATGARLNSPLGIAFDRGGNLYIADSGNDRIRVVTPGGTIRAFAGTGVQGSGGDGGSALAADLGAVEGVAADAAGDVYLSDVANHRVDVVSPSGQLAAYVGSVFGADGDGGPRAGATLATPFGIDVGSDGTLWIADGTNARVRRVAPNGTVTTVAGALDPLQMGPFVQAHFADPRALVVSPAFRFVAGGVSGTVQAAIAATQQLQVVAGRYPQSAAIGSLARFRSTAFAEVDGVAFDGSDHLYVAESTANRLDVVTLVDPADPATWTIASLVGASGGGGSIDGPIATARLLTPTGLFFDPTGPRLYIADRGNAEVRVIELAQGVVSTLAGVARTRGFFGDGGPATSALLFQPSAVTRCPDGDMFISDTGNNRIRRIAAGSDVITTVLGDGEQDSSGEGSPATSFPVDRPRGLACDASGNLFVASQTTVRLLVADEHGAVDGSGRVETIYGADRAAFPASATECLTGLAVVDATTVEVVDSCTGLLVQLRRELAP